MKRKMDCLTYQRKIRNQLAEIDRHFSCFFRPLYTSLGLTELQAKILFLLQDGGLPIGEIAQSLHITAGNASSMCKKLESMGHLNRTRNTGDERRVTAALTQKGTQTAEMIIEAVETRCQLYFSATTPETLDHILGALGELNQILKKFDQPQTK